MLKSSYAFRTNTGFSLVEALVALVVLSIGMMGIAGLYVASLGAGRTALLRTQAIALAGDMADRIRANPTGGSNYAKLANDTGTLTAACAPAGAGCTTAQMASYDIWSWHRVVDDRADDPSVGRLALPGGRGSIAVTGTNPRTYTITVQWAESGQTALSSYVVRLQV